MTLRSVLATTPARPPSVASSENACWRALYFYCTHPHPPVVTALISTHTRALFQEIDLKAGGGFVTTVGAMSRMMLIKLDWFGTMLPRMSVSVTKTLEQKLKAASQPDRYIHSQYIILLVGVCTCVQAAAGR